MHRLCQQPFNDSLDHVGEQRSGAPLSELLAYLRCSIFCSYWVCFPRRLALHLFTQRRRPLPIHRFPITRLPLFHPRPSVFAGHGRFLQLLVRPVACQKLRGIRYRAWTKTICACSLRWWLPKESTLFGCPLTLPRVFVLPYIAGKKCNFLRTTRRLRLITVKSSTAPLFVLSWIGQSGRWGDYRDFLSVFEVSFLLGSPVSRPLCLWWYLKVSGSAHVCMGARARYSNLENLLGSLSRVHTF